MKVLVTGSRNFADVATVFKALDESNATEIIHGGANGADSIASAWCRQKGVKETVIRPIFPSRREYYQHRNAEMVGMCDFVIAFWDKKRGGTKFTMTYAKKRGKTVVTYYEELPKR